MKTTEKGSYLKIKKTEYLILTAKSIAVMVLLNLFFYKSLWAIPVLLIPGALYWRLGYCDLVEKKKNEACLEFKELLLCSVTGLKAGYSVENAFLNSSEDIRKMFGTDSFAYRVLSELYISRKNNKQSYEVFERIGKQTDIEAISEFGEIYGIAYLKSGDLGFVIQKTVEAIVNNLRLKNEMYLELNEKIFEMKIMTVMPFLIIVYITLTSGSYFDAMYHNPIGIAIMTIALLVYVAAYVYAQKSINVIREI